MANVTEWVKKIREAIYGKDVRESIASSIEAMNQECTEAVAGYTQAIDTAESAAETAQEAAESANAAAANAAAKAGLADDAANNANDKAGLANEAAQQAQQQATAAQTAASAANGAADSANDAAESANTAAASADAKAEEASSAAQQAQQQAAAAQTAASAADAAADRANTAAEAIEGTDVGDLAVRVQDLEGEMDTVNSKIDGLDVQDITELQTELGTAQQDISQLQTGLSGKVDKETGKGLSSNDYTAADKAKVDAAPSYAEYQLTLASGLTGELHGYRIGNLCRIVGVVTGIKTSATSICDDLPDDLEMSSNNVPTVLSPAASLLGVNGHVLYIYRKAINGAKVLQGRMAKGFASIDPITNTPCPIDISYLAE